MRQTVGYNNLLNKQGKAMSDEDLKAELERLRSFYNNIRTYRLGRENLPEFRVKRAP